MARALARAAARAPLASYHPDLPYPVSSLQHGPPYAVEATTAFPSPVYAAPGPPCPRRANGSLSCHVPCLQEALNVLPNTATVKDTAALDEFQRVETERGVRPPPKKGLGEHMNDETNWKKVTSTLSRCLPCSHTHLEPPTINSSRARCLWQHCCWRQSQRAYSTCLMPSDMHAPTVR